MKRWKVWGSYEYILLSPEESKRREKAIKYFDSKGKLVAVQILRKSEELGQLRFPI
ncbi:MAG: hypothetical protein KBI09_08305 [Mesotoga sp.]|jgi:hypothetical protein|nr:hypothetical protein [Mesotoga sp.]HOI35306.1 hypothetical protein [Mesotoga infera]HOI63985.1 hypothetical protein [Mesotoga sp.]HON28794.1 hypothetical protein [Mesotoga infera]